MASVRYTVLGMLTQYPSIFPDKSACYRHLFLVNGNGYEWIDGELVDVCPSKTGPDFKNENEEVERQHGDCHYRSESMDNRIRLDVRRYNMLIQFALDNIDMIMDSEHVEFKSDIFVTYSGWEFCKLMQMPDDIKPDWLEAVRDVRWALVPCVNQAKRFKPLYDRGLENLERDLKRLKDEKFAHEYKTEEQMRAWVEKWKDENS